MLKFTILITTYNRLAWLKRAVHSALNQSYPCEVVVVDDASNDGTEAYAKSLGDAIVYLRNSRNLGHSKSINNGVKVARGDWIKLLDDDDYLAPRCVEEIVQAITAFPGAVICSCQAVSVNAQNRELRRTCSFGLKPIYFLPQEDIHYCMLVDKIAFGTPVQVAFQKEAFIKSGGWESTFDYNFDDIESWLKIAQYGDAVFVNQFLAYRTIWAENYSGKFSLQKRLETNIAIKEKLYQLVHKKHYACLPKKTVIDAFLRLHWGFIALKTGKILAGIELLWSSLCYPSSFIYLLRHIYLKKYRHFFVDNFSHRK